MAALAADRVDGITVAQHDDITAEGIGGGGREGDGGLLDPVDLDPLTDEPAELLGGDQVISYAHESRQGGEHVEAERLPTTQRRPGGHEVLGAGGPGPGGQERRVEGTYGRADQKIRDDARLDQRHHRPRLQGPQICASGEGKRHRAGGRYW